MSPNNQRNGSGFPVLLRLDTTSDLPLHDYVVHRPRTTYRPDGSNRSVRRDFGRKIDYQTDNSRALQDILGLISFPATRGLLQTLLRSERITAVTSDITAPSDDKFLILVYDLKRHFWLEKNQKNIHGHYVKSNEFFFLMVGYTYISIYYFIIIIAFCHLYM